MTPNPVTVPSDEKIREVAAILRKNHIGGLPVMDGRVIVGIVTETDILSLLKTGDLSDDLWLPSPLEIIEVPIREAINWEKTRRALSNIGDTPVNEVMSTNIIAIDEGADIDEAASVMLREGVARLPVLKDGDLTGIVTRMDIVSGIGAAYEPGSEEL